ncbi:hypothetical protein B0A50_02116 [Salinomyces thailandicus]|uniref:Uncharacterized protein n=1 Tax=Salinomyces thailandicus TaxID=706561 RepID=A0A4U0U7Y1_9PEZI|nr:hypothetical protein B0A50_02116 [Salinomyces thailandica]
MFEILTLYLRAVYGLYAEALHILFPADNNYNSNPELYRLIRGVYSATEAYTAALRLEPANPTLIASTRAVHTVVFLEANGVDTAGLDDRADVDALRSKSATPSEGNDDENDGSSGCDNGDNSGNSGNSSDGGNGGNGDNHNDGSDNGGNNPPTPNPPP